MATSFHSAALGLHRAAQASRGLAVTYSRGETTASVTAVPGRTVAITEDASGLTVRSVQRDWIVKAAALVLGGAAVLPEVGDQIRLTVADGVEVFEVQRLAGEPCYRPVDDLAAVLRIHTRKIDKEVQ